jgi:cation transport protein ChaC
MWVFGYGSLMYDGWEASFGCLEVTRADLPGYARIFNKKSTTNWGTRASPGPTLNLEPADGATCTGMAFRFDAARSEEVLNALRKREGKNFDLRQLRIRTPDGAEHQAVVALYTGTNTFATSSPAELARFAMTATGSSGRCRDYIDATHQHLKLLGIDDPAVSSVWKCMQKLIAEQPVS